MTEATIGLVTASETKNGYMHIDYDIDEPRKIRSDVKGLQKKHHLGDAALIQTSPGKYHAIFFWDTLTWGKISEVLKDAKHADPEFIEYTLARGKNRIRVLGDLKPVDIIHSPHQPNPTKGDSRYARYLALTGGLGNG